MNTRYDFLDHVTLVGWTLAYVTIAAHFVVALIGG